LAAEDWVGRVVDGRYEVEAVLGRGGMGVVLRARHKFTGARVALKTLHAELTMDPQIEARFLAEARAPNAIGHPAIVQVLDAGRMPEGELYLVMELLAGQPMRSVVSRRLGHGAIRRITLELLDALAAAHAHGFVHRDLKPENVFLADPGGTVKLLDFGIAKMVDAKTKMGTQAGVVLGTIAYMAPEQLHDAGSVDARADLWALGVMIYEMLAGRLPYRGTTVEEILVRVAREEPDPIRTWIPTITPAIEQFMFRALARDPAARFRSAAEMAAAFAQLPFDQPQVALPRSRPTDSSPMATLGTGIGATAAPSAPGLPVAHPARTPSLPVATYVPTPQPGVPAVAPPNRSRAIGIAFAVAAVGVIAAAIAIAKSHRSSAPKQAELAVGSATPSPPPQSPPPAPQPQPAAIPLDAAVPPPPVDAATPAPRQAPKSPAKTPQPQSPPPADLQPQQPYPQAAPPPPQSDACQASCALAAQCQMASLSMCLTTCHTNTLVNICAANSNKNCSSYAVCMVEGTCGKIFNGDGTCAKALTCQTQTCRFGDNNCGCGCSRGTSPLHALALFSADACLLACGTDAGCMSKNCPNAITRCLQQ